MSAASDLPPALDAQLPRDAPGPVFAAPWEALVFGLVLELHRRGVFAWSEWAQVLGAVIAEARAAGDPDRGDTYYLHWVKALERVLIGRGLANEGELATLAARLAREAHHSREQQLGHRDPDPIAA